MNKIFMRKTAQEIIERYFEHNSNAQPYFYWGGYGDKITFYKNNEIGQIYIDLYYPHSSAFHAGIDLTIKYPQEVDKLKRYLFVDARLNYYGNEFADLNEPNFIDALERHLSVEK